METIKLTKLDDGTYSISTHDTNGQWAELEQTQPVTDAANALFAARASVRPAWETEKVNLLAQVKTEKAAKEEAVTAKNEAVVEKAAALAEKDEAVAEKLRLEEKLDLVNAQLVKILSGGTATATPELLALYAPWQEGLSVDAGDAYVYDNVLYIAKTDHITTAENRPDLATAGDYWLGGIHGDGTTPPAPGAATKYSKGEVILWSGINYRALVDTDNDPGQAPEEWETAEQVQD